MTSAEEMPKHYQPDEVEARIYQGWLDACAFEAVPDARDERYVIMMPLPNITGALHMGHAIDNVMQDLLIRWHRMRGANALWQPGTDHAGIATQAVVEKRLKEDEGLTRHDIGREALVARIYAWKDEYQARIRRQQQQMGCSCAWDRQRFTMDPVCARAVRECFFRLFRDQLIYQGDRLVHLDCHLQTAVADDELYKEDVAGHFWHLRYPIVDPQPGEPTHVVVATTRPETMLGDTAVACHPDPRGALEALVSAAKLALAEASPREREAAAAEVDRLEARVRDHLPDLERLRDMARAGRLVLLPLQGREIPLILDPWAKPDLGSGCVKITPAHDPNDYEVWTRHRDRIGIVNLLNLDGTLNQNAGAYAGLDRMEAREKVLADLEAQGLVAAIEDRLIPIDHSDRSKTPIEPYLSKQWFVRMGDVPGADGQGLVMGQGTAKQHRSPGLAQAAIDAVEGEWRSPSGLKLTFFPDSERYAKTYLAWLKEKRDWCISRQLWWGHRIPIWCGEVRSGDLPGLVEALRPHHGRDLWVWFARGEEALLGLDEAAAYAGGEPLVAQLCLRSEAAEAEHEGLVEEFGLVQDPDVLDTWFSSALWPFSTLGWPDPETAAIEPGQAFLGKGENPCDSLEYYYPGGCLVTGRDIITLWVARMTIMGLYLLGDVPFHDSFIHANILDGNGEKMSKTKGNGIDPVDIIENYGTDALRYVLADLQTGSQDIRIPVQARSPYTEKVLDLAGLERGRNLWTYVCPDTGKQFDVLGTEKDLPKATILSTRFEVGRAFCTKLWNAARFAFLTLGEHGYEPLALERLEPEDRWVLSRLAATVEAVHGGIAGYAPSLALGAARDFFWNELCDWYLELVKPRMKDPERAPPARTVLAHVLDQVLRLLHPVVPFVTEELWARLGAQCPRRGLDEELTVTPQLIRAPWPAARQDLRDPGIERDFALLQDVVRAVRDVRARYQISPKQPLGAAVRAQGENLAGLERLRVHLQAQAGLESLELAEAPERPANAARAVVGEVEVFLAGVLDPVKERGRLEGQKAKLVKQIQGLEGRLGNQKFVAGAPGEVVAAARQQLADAQGQLASVEDGLRGLEA